MNMHWRVRVALPSNVAARQVRTDRFTSPRRPFVILMSLYPGLLLIHVIPERRRQPELIWQASGYHAHQRAIGSSRGRASEQGLGWREGIISGSCLHVFVLRGGGVGGGMHVRGAAHGLAPRLRAARACGLARSIHQRRRGGVTTCSRKRRRLRRRRRLAVSGSILGGTVLSTGRPFSFVPHRRSFVICRSSPWCSAAAVRRLGRRLTSARTT